MLFVESKTADENVEQSARLPLLERLQERGLVPLIRSTRLHCYETALLASDRAGEMEQALAEHATNAAESPYVRGDIFCFEDFVLFLIFDDEESAQTGLRAGIVYEAEMTDAHKELEAFCRNVGEALNSAREAPAGFMSEAIEWRSVETEGSTGAESFAAEHEVETV
ncbi:MAG TPA: hypothetical protein VGC64_07800, partial [Pyrinomonadaceae bacterium]